MEIYNRTHLPASDPQVHQVASQMDARFAANQGHEGRDCASSC